MSPGLEGEALCRLCLLWPSSVVCLSHQSQVLQDCPPCELCVYVLLFWLDCACWCACPWCSWPWVWLWLLQELWYRASPWVELSWRMKVWLKATTGLWAENQSAPVVAEDFCWNCVVRGCFGGSLCQRRASTGSGEAVAMSKGSGASQRGPPGLMSLGTTRGFCCWLRAIAKSGREGHVLRYWVCLWMQDGPSDAD